MRSNDKNKCINVSSKVLVKNHNAQCIVLISSEAQDYYQTICMCLKSM